MQENPFTFTKQPHLIVCFLGYTEVTSNTLFNMWLVAWQELTEERQPLEQRYIEYKPICTMPKTNVMSDNMEMQFGSKSFRSQGSKCEWQFSGQRSYLTRRTTDSCMRAFIPPAISFLNKVQFSLSVVVNTDNRLFSLQSRWRSHLKWYDGLLFIVLWNSLFTTLCKPT